MPTGTPAPPAADDDLEVLDEPIDEPPLEKPEKPPPAWAHPVPPPTKPEPKYLSELVVGEGVGAGEAL